MMIFLHLVELKQSTTLIMLFIGAKPPYYEMARVFIVVVDGSSSLIIRFRSNAVLNNNIRKHV